MHLLLVNVNETNFLLQADTVVNSTSDTINLDVSLSKALATKAGPELNKACRSIRPLTNGGVASTDGFKMGCRQIVHCNCPFWSKTSNSQVFYFSLCSSMINQRFVYCCCFVFVST